MVHKEPAEIASRTTSRKLYVRARLEDYRPWCYPSFPSPPPHRPPPLPRSGHQPLTPATLALRAVIAQPSVYNTARHKLYDDEEEPGRRSLESHLANPLPPPLSRDTGIRYPRASSSRALYLLRPRERSFLPATPSRHESGSFPLLVATGQLPLPLPPPPLSFPVIEESYLSVWREDCGFPSREMQAPISIELRRVNKGRREKILESLFAFLGGGDFDGEEGSDLEVMVQRRDRRDARRKHFLAGGMFTKRIFASSVTHRVRGGSFL